MTSSVHTRPCPRAVSHWSASTSTSHQYIMVVRPLGRRRTERLPALRVNAQATATEASPSTILTAKPLLQQPVLQRPPSPSASAFPSAVQADSQQLQVVVPESDDGKVHASTVTGFRREHRNKGQEQQQQQAKPHKWYRMGETVAGRVVYVGESGAKVQLFQNDEFCAASGWMPANESPYLLRESPAEDGPVPCIAHGAVREFYVLRHDKGKGGFRGPLLSARQLDWDMLWVRAKQLLEASQKYAENFRVRVHDVNAGGVLAHYQGLRLFIPVSHLERQGPEAWWSEQEMHDDFVGKDIEVAITEVDAIKKKLIGSVLIAKENATIRALKVGSLVEGTVRRVEPFGMFVGINGTAISGLIHISNISKMHVSRLRSHVEIGETIKAVVMGMDPDFTNISLSTAELEVESGDFINNRKRMWDEAEAQHAGFLEHLASLQQQLREAHTKGDAAAVEALVNGLAVEEHTLKEQAVETAAEPAAVEADAGDAQVAVEVPAETAFLPTP